MGESEPSSKRMKGRQSEVSVSFFAFTQKATAMQE